MAYQLYLNRIKERDENIHHVKEILLNKAQDLNLLDRKLLLIWTINDFSKSRLTDKKAKLEDIFELYKYGIEEKLLLNSGKLSD